MIECVVCGDNDFEEASGFYYCRTCSTQSQEQRVMVVEAEDHGFTFAGHSNRIHQKKARKEKVKKVVDLGRPWSIYEAYQHILLAQVEALIKLGAQPSLKDVVFKIWVNYLSKLGVAFTDTPVVDQLQKYGRQRELFPGTTGTPKIKNVRGRSRRKITVGISLKQAKKQIEKDQAAAQLEGEEFEKGDNPLEEEEKVKSIPGQEVGEDEWPSEEEGEIPLWGSKRKNINSRSVFKIRLSTTFSICYLALMYTNPVTTITDLVRWVETRQIPYLDVVDILPGDMKFCYNDWKLFGMGVVPSPVRMRSTVGSLACFLNMTDFPEYPLTQLISKYILMLDLPVDFHGLTMNMYRSHPPVTTYRPIKNFNRIVFWEGMAMAYIIVALKLIFGLDDHTERLFSVYSRELMKLTENSEHLFVFDDWMTHITIKMNISVLETPGQESDNTDTQHTETDKVLDKLGKQKEGEPSIDTRFKLFQSRVRNAIQKPLLELSKNIGASHTDAYMGTQSSESLTSDPGLDLSVNTLQYEDSVGHMTAKNRNEGSSQNEKSGYYAGDVDNESSQRGNFFRSCTVRHLSCPEIYLEQLYKEDLFEHSLYSTCAPSCGSGQEEKNERDFADDNSMDLFQEESNSQKKRKRHNHPKYANQSRLKHSIRSFIQANVESSPLVSNVVNKDRYRFVMEQIQHVRENFLISFDPDSLDSFVAYNWLLYVCGSFLNCEANLLLEEVRKLEILLFTDIEDVSKKGRSNWKKMRKNSNHFAKRLRQF